MIVFLCAWFGLACDAALPRAHDECVLQAALAPADGRRIYLGACMSLKGFNTHPQCAFGPEVRWLIDPQCYRRKGP
jgi:hypothetical protein